MRGIFYSYPVKLAVLFGAIVAAVIIIKLRGLFDLVVGTLNASSDTI
jgi:hypothetical protein